jgi:hypothetical protein
MPRLRYNITAALGAILFVAVGFAALREADELWDSWLFSLTLGLLLFAVLLAAHRTGDRGIISIRSFLRGSRWTIPVGTCAIVGVIS